MTPPAPRRTSSKALTTLAPPPTRPQSLPTALLARSARAVGLECPDELGDVAGVLGLFRFWQVQRGLENRLDASGVSDDAFGVAAVRECPVPRARGEERHVWPVVALAKTGIPDQVHV